MATPVTYNDLDDKDKKPDTDPNQAQQQGQQSGVNVSGSQSSTVNSQANPAAPNNNAGSGGRFSNLQNYLNANKDSNLAGKIGSNLDNQANNIKSNTDKSYQDFQTQASGVSSQFADPNYAQTVLKDPSKYADDPNVSKFQGYYNAYDKNQPALNTLSGGLSNYNDLSNQAANYNQQAQAAQSETGRFGLLKNMFGTPTYNYGQQQLDNLLIQGNPDQLKALSAQTGQAQNVTSNLDAIRQKSLDDATALKTQAQQTQDATRGLVGNENDGTGTLGNLVGDINKAVTTDNANAIKNYDDVQKQIKNNQYSNDTLVKLGLKAGQHIYDVDPSKYINSNRQDATVATAASPEQAANYLALQKLIGGNGNLLSQDDLAKAGTFQANPTIKSAAADVAAKDKAYQDWYNNAHKYTATGEMLPQATMSPAEMYNYYLWNATPHQIDGHEGSNPAMANEIAAGLKKLQEQQNYQNMINQSDWGNGTTYQSGPLIKPKLLPKTVGPK